MGKAFDGVRVIDFTQVFSGPYATSMLTLLGADVIKVEQPGTGDISRGLLDDGPLAAAGMSPVFQGMNAGKRAITLNLKHPDAAEVVERLVREADVVIENLRPVVMERLGVGYEAMRAIRPDLIYCSISGYGQSGPKSGATAYDGAVQAASGMMSVTGEAEAGPMRVGFAVVDLGTAVMAGFAVASALYRRSQTGEGQYLDVSMLDTSLALLSPLISNLLMAGNEPAQLGNLSLTRMPTGNVFPTAAGDLQITALTESQVQALCECVGAGWLMTDARFTTAEQRLVHSEEMRAALIEALAEATAAEWEERLSAVGVPIARVLTIAQVVKEPQVAHRGVLLEVPGAGPDAGSEGNAATVVNMGFIANEDGPHVETAAPRLGQDTDAVLRELGFDEERIAELRSSGAI